MLRAMFLFLLTFVMVVPSLMVGSSGSAIPPVGLNMTKNRFEKLWDARLVFDDIVPDTLSRNALSSPTKIWPDGKVYFKIHKGFDDERVKYIYRAMYRISAVSCVTFIPAPKNATTFLGISVDPTHCRAQLGYGKGIRHLSLALDELDTGCFKIGAIAHELMHALGFIHQHSIPERDKYVNILYKNIRRSSYLDFEKWPRSETTDLGLPYDFGSILHYPLWANSKNGKKTIVPIVDPGDVEIGQEKGLSKLDIVKLNKLYKCCV